MLTSYRAPGKEFQIRPDNERQDVEIIKDVYVGDCYRYRRLDAPHTVVDVGAHIGAFSSLVHRDHPKCRIIACEVCPENIPCLTANVGEFATVVHAAITYEPEIALLNSVFPKCASTGGSIVCKPEQLAAHPAHYWADRRPLAKKTLEEIMAENNLDQIDILKLDCEGSEFSILWNSTSLDRVRHIIGEWHEIRELPERNWQHLIKTRYPGWRLRVLSEEGPFGLFWLYRT